MNYVGSLILLFIRYLNKVSRAQSDLSILSTNGIRDVIYSSYKSIYVSREMNYLSREMNYLSREINYLSRETNLVR